MLINIIKLYSNCIINMMNKYYTIPTKNIVYQAESVVNTNLQKNDGEREAQHLS